MPNPAVIEAMRQEVEDFDHASRDYAPLTTQAEVLRQILAEAPVQLICVLAETAGTSDAEHLDQVVRDIVAEHTQLCFIKGV